MIDSLGTITVESESDIAAAQKAYDALSDKEKKSVSNYSTLEEAITQFKE